MYDEGRIAGLASQLPALGKHLTFRPELPADGRVSDGRRDEPRRLADAEGKAAAERDALLQRLDGELAELNHAIESQKRHARPGEGGALGALEARAGDLAALRTKVELAHSPAMLASLKVQVTESVSQAASSVQAVSASAPATASSHMLAEASYHARMTSIERDMGAIVREDAARFAGTERLAARHGVDIGGFRQAKSVIEEAAEDARKKNDRTTAVMADALGVRASALAARKVADGIDGAAHPEDKAKAEKAAGEAQQAADRAEQDARKAVEATAERESAAAESKGQLHFGSDDERKAWIKGEADRRMQPFHEIKKKLEETGTLSHEDAARLSEWKSADNAALKRRDMVSAEPAMAGVKVGDQRQGEQTHQELKTAFAAGDDTFGSSSAPNAQVASLDPKTQEAAKQAAKPAAAAGAAGDGKSPAEEPKAPAQVASAAQPKDKGAAIG